MSIQRVDTGARLSKVVVHGDTVYLAGLTADKTVGQSVAAQTQEILATIETLLAKGETDKEIYVLRRLQAGEGGSDSGLGMHFVNSSLNADYTLTVGLALLYAVLLIVLNLAVDFSYSFLDPRVRHG